jgi:hypothetical protein
MSVWHLAQINVARMRGPLDSSVMAAFAAQIPAINALAEASSGFVWRLQVPAGDATTLRVFPDPLLLVNLSVWETIDALRQYVYHAAHGAAFRDRAQWFEPIDEAHLALWWIRAGTEPTLEEASERLERIRSQGPTPEAFSFAQPFEAPAE